MFKRLKETILEIIQQADLILLGLCCAASVFGIAMIYSATRYDSGAAHRHRCVFRHFHDRPGNAH